MKNTPITAIIVALLTALAACGGEEFSASDTDAGAGQGGGSAGKAGAAGQGGASSKAGASGAGGSAAGAQGGAAGKAGSATGGSAGSGVGGASPGGFCANQAPHKVCTDFESDTWAWDWTSQQSGGELGVSTETASSLPNSLMVKLAGDGSTDAPSAQLFRSLAVNGIAPTHVHVTANLNVLAIPSPDIVWVGALQVQFASLNIWFGWRGGQLMVWTEDSSAPTLPSQAVFEAFPAGSWHSVSIDVLILGGGTGNIGVQVDSQAAYLPNLALGPSTNASASVAVGLRMGGGGEEQIAWFDNITLDWD